MSPIPEPLEKHVPAWKKLGLKLKFAKEEPEDTQPTQNGTVYHKKRKAPADEEAVTENVPAERSAKKVKKSKASAKEAGGRISENGTSQEPRDENKPRKKIKNSKYSAGESVEAVNGNRESQNEPSNTERPSKKAKNSKLTKVASTVSIDGTTGDSQERKSSPPPVSKTTPASKAKSVSFTPDTKKKDGDSVKSLYKAWFAKQIATDPSFDPSTVSPALRSIVPSTVASPESPSPATSTSASISKSEPTTKVNKKHSKKPKIRLPKTSSGAGPSRFDPVLTYLTTHHTSPQTWKFSKPHQNQILKHLFSLSHIPSSHDIALYSYIRGLKGTSARSRIRKQALAVREEDNKWLAAEPSDAEKMETETVAQCIARRRRDYEAAVARIKQTLREKEDEREEIEWELSGEKEEWEERVRKRRRAEIVLWNVGEEEEEAAEGDGVALPQQDPSGGNAGRQMKSGVAQLVHAARDPGPAPRVGRGVGMGMGGVEVIDASGIAKASQGKKVLFSDDGPTQAAGSTSVNGFGGGANGGGQANGEKMSDVVNGANGVNPKRKRKRKRRTGVPDDDDSSSSESSSSSSDESGEERQQQQRDVVMQGGAEESSDEDTSTSDSD
ncbi:hypothetical protein IMSHALPRED_011016 [Imshaugia aleurites]|uniref:WKF domain-containing protein n=1 Tax=Imshaugia aleurites TaxID=172621 RepID=A0A8H3G5T2_9LECA|nr:hypothetical protein IMSHALPRED_011016 [Imshaugia aleurites]